MWFDIRVARFAASPELNYAMFSGGGLAWAEARMKAGEFSIPPGPPGCRPDLSGLSCRFEEMPSRREVILSIIVQAAYPDPAAPEASSYRALIEDVIRLVEESPDMARPVPEGGPPLAWPPSGTNLRLHTDGDLGGSVIEIERRLIFNRELPRPGGADRRTVQFGNDAEITGPLPSGDMGGGKRHGFCHGDVRFIGRDCQKTPENRQIVTSRGAEPDRRLRPRHRRLPARRSRPVRRGRSPG